MNSRSRETEHRLLRCTGPAADAHGHANPLSLRPDRGAGIRSPAARPRYSPAPSGRCRSCRWTKPRESSREPRRCVVPGGTQRTCHAKHLATGHGPPPGSDFEQRKKCAERFQALHPASHRDASSLDVSHITHVTHIAHIAHQPRIRRGPFAIDRFLANCRLSAPGAIKACARLTAMGFDCRALRCEFTLVPTGADGIEINELKRNPRKAPAPTLPPTAAIPGCPRRTLRCPRGVLRRMSQPPTVVRHPATRRATDTACWARHATVIRINH